MDRRLIAVGVLTVCAATYGVADEIRLTYPIVDTNQTALFDARGATTEAALRGRFQGQDAHHFGAQPHYRDNGDGTVTDLVTGLVWEQGFRRLDWGDAAAAAAAATTGGHRDWRVPTIKELYSLVQFSGDDGMRAGAPPQSAPQPRPGPMVGHPPGGAGRPGRPPLVSPGRPGGSGGPPGSPGIGAVVPDDAIPFIDTDYFAFEYPSDRGRYIDAQYISSTVYTATVMNGQRCFFGLNIADGRIKCYPIAARQGEPSGWYVRFVRGNPAYGVNDFIENGDGTVTDAATGLMWTRVDTGDPALSGAGAITWEEALALAESATFAGHDDWRLPNAKELHSLIDYTRSPDATGSPAIDPVFDVTRVINVAGAWDYPAFWTSTSFEPGADAVVLYFGRALGYMSPQGQWGNAQFMDVHGAGAQRSDPKTGQGGYGQGPQGDVRSVRNFARLVRDAL